MTTVLRKHLQIVLRVFDRQVNFQRSFPDFFEVTLRLREQIADLIVMIGGFVVGQKQLFDVPAQGAVHRRAHGGVSPAGFLSGFFFRVLRVHNQQVRAFEKRAMLLNLFVQIGAEILGIRGEDKGLFVGANPISY